MTPSRLQPPRWRLLSLPKQGSTAEEYEDAWAADASRGRFALSDGASESAFAGLWARLLANGFIAAKASVKVASWLGEVRSRWNKEVADLELPWYAEMKRDQGAFGTLLGLEIQPPSGAEPGRWQSVALGDSCLVRVRKRREVRAFPIRCAADFNNQPTLFCSRGNDTPTMRTCSGSVLPGDRFFLMTDALAEWFLASHERRGCPWLALARVLVAESSDETFAAFVEGLRARGELRNDDVTLLGLDFSRTYEE